MKSFKTLFLEKANIKSDVLYHCTNIYPSGIKILTNNYLRSTKGLRGDFGISTTTDKNYWWGGKELRLVLDRKKVKKKYRLKVIDEKIPISGELLDESEILILDGPLIDLNKYLIRIEYVKSKINKKFMEILNLYINKYKILIKIL